MLFNSYSFIVFLLLVLMMHRLPLSWRVRKFNLLWASYVFYAAWNPPFVLLLAISTVVDWYAAKAMASSTSAHGRRALLGLSLTANLGLLGFFKYGNFALENFTALVNAMGIAYKPAELDIILPVGISFYTFQTLSYSIDVYRHRARPWHSFVDYALYVSFFPQLVAGPIVRAHQFLPQCNRPHRVNGGEMSWGLSLLVLGLFEKIVVADSVLAPIAESVYDASGQPGLLTSWCGTLAFAGQIFCDFAGYSTCAIGVARCLGFSLPLNFRFPYGALGFSDFWRRWHITLSTWFRDYAFASMGRSRRSRLLAQLKLVTTMALVGLWHGASWTFVAWGTINGFYLVLDQFLRRWIGGWKIWQWSPMRVSLCLATFAMNCVAVVAFRAADFDRAITIWSALFGGTRGAATMGIPLDDFLICGVTMSMILAIHISCRNRSLEQMAAACPWPLRSAVIALMLVMIVTMSGDNRAFIYFQF